MKIRWNGHASFTITSANNTVIVTDPYDSGAYGDEFTYDTVRDRADGVIISHMHPDHSYTEGLSGTPLVLKGSGEIMGITVKGIDTHHDESGGSRRGDNTVFRLTVDGITICFLGDLGHIPSADQISDMAPVDLLLIPVGGTYTLNADMALKVVELTGPKVAIPMHFRTKKCLFPISGPDDFLAGINRVKRPGLSEIDLTPGMLPETGTEAWLMDHAC